MTAECVNISSLPARMLFQYAWLLPCSISLLECWLFTTECSNNGTGSKALSKCLTMLCYTLESLSLVELQNAGM